MDGLKLNSALNDPDEIYKKYSDKIFEKIEANSQKLRERLMNAGKSEKDMHKVKEKCMRIAQKIMSGKKVTQEEKDYLRENDPELYALAMYARSLQKIIDNEEDNEDIYASSCNYNRKGKEDENFPPCYIFDDAGQGSCIFPDR